MGVKFFTKNKAYKGILNHVCLKSGIVSTLSHTHTEKVLHEETSGNTLRYSFWDCWKHTLQNNAIKSLFDRKYTAPFSFTSPTIFVLNNDINSLLDCLKYGLVHSETLMLI